MMKDKVNHEILVLALQHDEELMRVHAELVAGIIVDRSDKNPDWCFQSFLGTFWIDYTYDKGTGKDYNYTYRSK